MWGCRWEEFFFHGFFRVIGVVSAFYMHKMMNAFQGCMLGAHLIADVIKDEVEKSGTLLEPHVINTLQLALVTVGLVSQFKSTSAGQVPFLLRPVMCVPLSVEGLLSACASKAMWSNF